LFVSYCFATSGAMAAALGGNHIIGRMKNPPKLVAALVPFIAVAAANAINIPMMRSNEFVVGIPVEDRKGEILGSSLKVPYTAIPLVTVSRIGMAIPAMVIGPAIFQKIMKMRCYRVKDLEPELQKKIQARKNPPEVVYYNKGL
uniref:DUF2062 domain-containing protein n=1 Tax=Heligmosomoides polygyrus TaxID=6339 RepID=A0A183FIK5_HELPZ